MSLVSTTLLHTQLICIAEMCGSFCNAYMASVGWLQP
jgi:hypothetical protein